MQAHSPSLSWLGAVWVLKAEYEASSLQTRLSVLDFVSQLFSKVAKTKTWNRKLRFEAMDLAPKRRELGLDSGYESSSDFILQDVSLRGRHMVWACD